MQSQTQFMATSGRNYRERLLRIPDVCFLTGLGRSTVYAKVKERQFPQPVKLHGTCVAWKETEVDAWISERPMADAPAPEPIAAPAVAKPLPRTRRSTKRGA